jgi:transmembrane sensor
MDDLILRHLGGEATDVDEHRLERWRAASEANEARYRELEGLWSGLGRIETPRAARRPAPAAWIAEAERRRERARASRLRRAIFRSPWAAYGTAVAATAVLAWVAVHEIGTRRAVEVLSAVESSVGPGRVVALTLSDGTFLRAAEGASLEFPAEAGRREVVLTGRAFFAVAHGEEPFVVRTAAGELTVKGTRFEVRAEEGALRVVVVEGTVELAGPGGSAEVGAGQVATVEAGGTPRVMTVGDVWQLLDWPSGLLAFQRTSLGEVAGQLEHQFGVDVRIADSVLAARRVTGSFQDDSLDQVVDAVCAVTGIRCERRGDAFILGVPPR